ncbi:hypothetical protein C8J57DRAFT_1728291 [Mycena rebaudengoi]|nr:hypothetical protein C8J57DRAFT_1728291 [Mycena rebaudengoi]
MCRKVIRSAVSAQDLVSHPAACARKDPKAVLSPLDTCLRHPSSPSSIPFHRGTFIDLFWLLNSGTSSWPSQHDENAKIRRGTSCDAQWLILGLFDVSTYQLSVFSQQNRACDAVEIEDLSPSIAHLLCMNIARIFRILLKPSVRATPASSSDIRAEQCQQTLLHPRPWEINRSLAAMRCTMLYQPFCTAG